MTSGPDIVPLNDLSRSWIARSEAVAAALERVMASGWYVQGPEHDAFEAELAAFIGVPHALGVASGTDALALALAAVGVEPGAEVVAAANAGGYATIAATQIGAIVAYADIDPATGLVTAETLEEAIGPRTSAAVVTHLYGNVADLDPIVRLCQARGIAVVEDCAQAIGGWSGQRRVGAIGDAAAFSFYPTKNLGAMGDGGAVATRRDDVAGVVRELRQYGWDQRYRIGRPGGRNSRLDELQAAVLRIGLREVDHLNERRRGIVERYASAVNGTAARMVTGASATSVAHLAVLRSADRDALRRMLGAEGIQTSVHYPLPDHRQPGLPRPRRRQPLPETERMAREILTLPCFPELTAAEVDRVATAVREGLAS